MTKENVKTDETDKGKDKVGVKEDGKDDIIDLLEEGGKEPKDESPDRGFLTTDEEDEDGEPIKLDKESDKTKVISIKPEKKN